jgi:hypothetical protein
MPQEVHRIVQNMRSARDEEMLDLVRETVAQLNKLGDRLESYVREASVPDVREDDSAESGQGL